MAIINNRIVIRDTMERIAIYELADVNTLGAYNNQRTIISSLFKSEYTVQSIIQRLTIIDSLYSTNASYSYFSFEEMAEKIYGIGAGKMDVKCAIRDYFYDIATGGKDTLKLFSEPYGYQKNLSEGAKQMSLLSKYAYYELLQEPEKYPLGFPIYDTLAREAYPVVRKMLGEADYYTIDSNVSIENYIVCLEQLRTALFDDRNLFKIGKMKRGYQQFDILDAYLWRMGKFSGGNLSLLLSREDYAAFIVGLGIAAPLDKKTGVRSDTDEYWNSLIKKYNRLLGKSVEKQKDIDFNKLILHYLSEKKSDMFKGLKSEKYMITLFDSWDIFHSYKDKPFKAVKFKS